MERTAMCACGTLRVKVRGEPMRVAVCHCVQCQKRSGSVFADNAHFDRRSVVAIEGESKAFARATERGGRVTFHFCMRCGSSVYWDLSLDPNIVGVAVGAFGDPGFAKPTRSLFGVTRHHWVPPLEDGEAYLADQYGSKE